MTINNNTAALPGVAVVIYRVLREVGTVGSEDDLIGLCAPASAISAMSSNRMGDAVGTQDSWREGVRSTSSLLKEFGVIAKDKDGVRLTPEVQGSQGDEHDVTYLARVLRARFLDGPYNKDLWSSDQGARDFTRLITWYLMQDVVDAPRDFNGVSALQHRQLSTGAQVRTFMASRPTGAREEILVTSTRWNVFERWATFTGLARADVGGLLPDPTDAIADTLLGMTTGALAPLGQFLPRIAEAIPVLDDGTYWLSVHSELDQGSKERLKGSLSPSLSHALLRLHEVGRLHLEDRADAPDKVQFVDGSRRITFSHVEVTND